MSSEILAANLAALAAAGGPAASIASAPSDRIRVTTAGAMPVVELADASGSWYRLHSGRDPAREAAGLLDGALGGKPLPSLVAVLGAGLGWVLDELERRDAGVRVIVFDPWPGLSRVWMARRSLEPWFESGRLAVVTGPDYEGLTRLWGMVDAEGAPPVVVANPPMIRVLPDEMRQARQALDRLVYAAFSNASARQRFGLRYLVNTLENLPRVMAEGDVADLRELARGRMAVIVGAGPSLDVNVAALRRASGRAILIAADTALRPLLTQGVKPDIVVCLDPSETNATHLQNLPECRDVWLVAEASVAPAALPAFEGRTFFYRISNADPWPWLEQHGLTIGRLNAWGSVVTAGLGLAVAMGCTRVVFAGLDLAYTRGQPYCRHATIESIWAKWIAVGDTLAAQWSACSAADLPRRPDIAGGDVATTATLIEFRDWLVEQTRALGGVAFVNATGAGILAGGRIVPGTLDEEFGKRSASPELEVVGRWLAGQRGRRVSAVELRRRLAEQAEGELPDAWSGLVGSDGEPRVREALLHAVRALNPDGPGSCQYVRVDRTPHHIPWLPAADVAGIVRSLLTSSGRLFGSERPPVVEPGWTAERFLDVARRELQQVLASEPELATPAEVIGDRLSVPARFAYHWDPAVLEHVQAFEEALACLLALARPSAALVPGWLAWAGEPVEPVLDAAADDSPAVPPSAAEPGPGPHLALCSELALAIAHVLSSETGRSQRARRWAAFAASLRRGRGAVPSPDLLASPTAWSEDSDPPWPEQTVWQTARIRTGQLEALTPVPRSLGELQPRVLTSEGLPRCYRAWTWSAGEALVTAGGYECSFRVGEHGDWALVPAWRHLIHGEIPSGHAGGGLAYDAINRCVMARPSSGSGATIQEVEFTPLAVAEGTDGRVWWCAKEGGVWQGRPGREPVRLAAASPPLSSIELFGSSVVLTPGHYRTNGTQMRLRDDRRWVLDTSTLSIEEQATGPLGPSLMRSVGGGWEADAHPLADAVHLRRQSTGETALLQVYFPLAAVWAGASLVVVCNDGHVLLFASLQGRLDEALGIA